MSEYLLSRVNFQGNLPCFRNTTVRIINRTAKANLDDLSKSHRKMYYDKSARNNYHFSYGSKFFILNSKSKYSRFNKVQMVPRKSTSKKNPIWSKSKPDRNSVFPAKVPYQLLSIHTPFLLPENSKENYGLAANPQERTPSFQSQVNRLNIISPKACATLWTFAVSTPRYFLDTCTAKQVVAFCNYHLTKKKGKRKTSLVKHKPKYKKLMCIQ